MMADGIRDKRIGSLEIGVFFLRQQLVFVVVGDEHPFGADEQHSVPPLGNISFFHKGRIATAVIPGQCDRGQVAACGIFLPGDRPARGALRMNRTFGLDAGRVSQFQRPEGQIAIVTEEIAQVAVGEIPPVSPSLWGINRVVGPVRGGPQPQVPIERGRHGRTVHGGILL